MGLVRQVKLATEDYPFRVRATITMGSKVGIIAADGVAPHYHGITMGP
jgi:hypothetical protein